MKTNTPKLRFPEFRNAPAWKEERLEAFADLYKGKGISKADISADGKIRCIRYGELYTSYSEIIETVLSATNLPASELFFSKKNDVIVPSSGETKEDISTASCVMLDDIALGGDLNVIRCDQCGKFISYYLNGQKKKEIAKIAQGDTVVHLYAKQLKQLEIALPKPLEQQKIADCLSSLDGLISTESRKLDTLASYKKGLMQQLFPAEGETVPKLRFPEFRNAPAWEKKKLGKVLVERKEKNAKNLLICSVAVKKGVISQIEHLGRSFSAKDTSNYGVVHYGDIVYTKSPTGDFPYGIIKQSQLKEDVAVSPLYGVYEPQTYALGFMLHCYFEYPEHTNNYLYPLIQKGAKNTINIKNQRFLENELMFPTDKDESQKIADCLASLDELISVQTEKLDGLKNFKKGMMQQLFPTVDEVSV